MPQETAVAESNRVITLKALLLQLVVLAFTLTVSALAEGAPDGIPADRLLSDEELVALLNTDAEPTLEPIQRLFADSPEEAMQALAAYFREAFSERYYFDWRNLGARFTYYSEKFPERRAVHRRNAEIHKSLYPAEARWLLPYRNLKGDEVTAYELRHLARQHKMLDMAFMHLYENRNPENVRYFAEQMRSLNRAFVDGEFEDDEGGNGVYESFRAGYRVMNWLQLHAFYLGSPDYSWQDQVELIRTLLHTGAVLHRKNPSFRYGNHQTRGAAALAMIAILLRDFKGTEAWYRDAMRILGEHLEREVNADGFQFERSVHYHIGDIFNFFRVMQLAGLNGLPVPDAWRDKLKGMFEAAVVLARPDGPPGRYGSALGRVQPDGRLHVAGRGAVRRSGDQLLRGRFGGCQRLLAAPPGAGRSDSGHATPAALPAVGGITPDRLLRDAGRLGGR
jgi:hypothetical protein